MNQVPMSLLLRTLDALDKARSALCASNAPMHAYVHCMEAANELRVALQDMQPVTVTPASVPAFLTKEAA